MKFNRTQIKRFALFTMTLNHIAEVFLPEGTRIYTVLCDIGYFTAITMIYFLVEGYGYTKDKKKYAARLFVFAIVAQVPFHLCFEELYMLNMLFTLFICFILCEVQFSNLNDLIKIITAIILTLLCIGSDWSFFAPVFTMLFITAKKGNISHRISFIFSIGLYFIMTMLIEFRGGSLLTALMNSIGEVIAPMVAAYIILEKYNGEKGDYSPMISKWMFYVYYPLHLLILWGAKCIYC